MTTSLSRIVLIINLMFMLTCLLAQSVLALPEDADQPMDASFDNSELLLNEGLWILYGNTDTPAKFTQGTLEITGQEITIVRIDGDIQKVTVTGNPAHFQQQPAIDQGLAIALGSTIILDYQTQHMSAIGKVTFTQDGNIWSGCRVDYYIEDKRLTTPLCENGERASLFIPPRNGQ